MSWVNPKPTDWRALEGEVGGVRWLTLSTRGRHRCPVCEICEKEIEVGEFYGRLGDRRAHYDCAPGLGADATPEQCEDPADLTIDRFRL